MAWKVKMVFPNSDKCVVEWMYNKLDGQATVTYTNGANYEGEWRDGKRHGQETMTFVYGIEYVGEWKDDTFSDKSVPHLTSNIPENPDV